MALSSISYNKDKEEEKKKKKKDTDLGKKDNLTPYSSSSLLPAQTRKEEVEEGLKGEKIATTTTTTTTSSNIPEVFDSSKYDSMAEIKESAADMKKEGGKEHLKEEEEEEVLSNIQREEPIRSESVDTAKPSDIDLNSPVQPQQLPPSSSPSTITATADTNSPSIPTSYMTSWHDYVNAAFNVYSESIRAATKITEHSLGMFWQPWLGRYSKQKDRMKGE
jgi:hypothetical protein